MRIYFFPKNFLGKDTAMQLEIPEKLNALAERADFPLYVVGGTVRDALAGLPSAQDWDICAPADAEHFSALAQECGFTVNGVYKNTGTVNLTDGTQKYEFTSFRTDVYRRGEHAPSRVTFTKDIVTDARRRDFKCNAVYYDIAAQKIVDPLGGEQEIGERKISTTREADEVFSEDGLRLMRLARLAAQTGFVPTLECIFGAKFNAALIAKITPERIYAELQLLLHADEKYGRQYAHYEGLKLLEGTEVLNYILPELAAGKGMPQRKDFHDHDVLEHSLRACKYADRQVRLTALLHDVGKPVVYSAEGHYHGHDAAGERTARDILERLKAPKKLTDTVCRLISLHMYDLDGKAKENKVRRLIVANYDIYPLLRLVKQADYSGCKDDTQLCPTLRKWDEIEKKMQQEGVPFTLKQLALRGDALENIPPRRRGEILHKLLLWCSSDGALNNAKTLLKQAQTFLEDGND